MLAALVCTCSGASQRARKVFQKAGINGWLDVPVYEGKLAQQNFWSSIPQDAANSLGAQVLAQHLTNKGSYNVIVGYTDDSLVWASIHNASTQEQLDAIIIAKNYSHLS